MRILVLRPRLFLLFFIIGTVAVRDGRAAENGLPSKLPDFPKYEVGQQVEADVVTPIGLVVFDPIQTEALRQSEAQKVAPIFRHDPEAAAAVEAELRRDFSERRDRFVRLIEAAFQRHPLRTERELQDPRFAESILVFRSKHPGFPLNTNLAELWALGESGAVVLDGFCNTLRRLMAAYIREDRLPPGERLGAGGIRIVRAGPSNGASVAAGELRTTTVSRTNLFSLTRFKQEVGRLAPAGDKPSLDFVTGYLRANCTFDAEATALARERRVQALNVLDQYPAGQTLARQGQTVDLRLKLALDELHARTAAGRLESDAAKLRADVDRIKAEASQFETAARLEQLKAKAAASAIRKAVRRQQEQLLAGIVVTAIGCVILAVLWWRHWRRQTLAPGVALSLYREDDFSSDAQAWRARALAAEARADKAATLLRASVVPHLARWMMTELVQKLLAQKTEVQSTQQRAEVEVAELAERLEKLHAPLEDRLRAYERRIAELESELAARDQQHHQLIQAQIESTRRKLEDERGVDVPAWN